MTILENVPLAPRTTIGIGGPARWFVRVTNVDEVREALDWAKARNVAAFILGGGSNLLISDDGFDGLVIAIELRGITILATDGDVAMVRVAAGERWDDFVAFAVDRGWAGIECLSGIPGQTGATPIQNVGAYGQEVSETIARVEALDRTTGLVRDFTAWDCRFGYRSSLFKNYERDRYVIISVVFRLRRGGSATVKYPELLSYLEERGIGLDDLRSVRDAVIAIRKRKGMVLDPTDPDTRSDGSFFMNPILSATDYERFAAIAPTAPHFPGNDGTVKLSAAWLIEHAGFGKGYVHGNVGLSSKHTLAVINRGRGTAAEVKELVAMIQQAVQEKFGVAIFPEPNFL